MAIKTSSPPSSDTYTSYFFNDSDHFSFNNAYIGSKPNDIPIAGYSSPLCKNLVMILSYLPPPPRADLNSPVLSNTSQTHPVYISSPLAKKGVNLHKSNPKSTINLFKSFNSFNPSFNNSILLFSNSLVNSSRFNLKYSNTLSTFSFEVHASSSSSISSLFNLSN